MSDNEEEWGQLISESAECIKLKKSKIMLGRAKDCDVKVDNRQVSGHHCYLERNELGKIFIYDTSTNGTFVNCLPITKGKSCLLNDGDEVFLLLKADDPDNKISFLYKESGNPLFDDTQATLEYSNDIVKDYSNSSQKSDHDEPDCKRSKQQIEETEDNVHSSQSPGSSTLISVKADDCRKDSLSALDMMEENLLCSICQEIYHDCISLQPCMHCFCAGCYSPWMKKSNECPQCRNKVVRISKNHIVNNLVEVFLSKHSDKKRSLSVIEELNVKNEITHDMLYPQKVENSQEYLCNSQSSEDSDYSDNSPHNPCSSNGTAYPYLPVPVVKCRQCPDYNGPYKIQDRKNCSDVIDGPSTSTSNTAGAGTSGTYQLPPFTCSASTIHAYCQCCGEAMPDRRQEQRTNPDMPAQQCSRCYGLFCHMYWGCKRIACNGCLSTFSNMNFGDKCMTGIINENTYESEVLLNFLQSQNMTWRELLQTCIEHLETQAYSCNPIITPTTILCYPCALSSFRQLAYEYRKSIPNTSLPTAVTSRPNCYWGHNCRTQKTRHHHAVNFNHICEQTKYA